MYLYHHTQTPPVRPRARRPPQRHCRQGGFRTTVHPISSTCFDPRGRAWYVLV
ncbi:hypothetical protein SMACR_02349 [Sordaria macrospora]|uniref:Uncharacterized protein n=1 Tax=Sordaria macrospora TaxID=5147 RepID=A0A8S8ZZU4_SORMA|nr:hypothetical protein SMACR_02349 [Sordaria macrospora]WPJ64733.1 hypothetical protein SMAC4_02349 [Sordaria macrospora]